MGDEKIFPLVDRKTPVLDRFRNGKGKNYAEESAKEVVALREASEDEAMELMETFSEDFRDQIADEIDEDPENVNPELVEEFMSFVFFEGSLTELSEEDSPLSSLSSSDDEDEDPDEE